MTNVMLPCVMEFHCPKAYFRSSGRPTNDQMMLRYPVRPVRSPCVACVNEAVVKVTASRQR